MKNLKESDILSKFMEITKAQECPTSPEDEAELESLKDQDVQSDRDRIVQQSFDRRKAQEQKLLDLARGNRD